MQPLRNHHMIRWRQRWGRRSVVHLLLLLRLRLLLHICCLRMMGMCREHGGRLVWGVRAGRVLDAVLRNTWWLGRTWWRLLRGGRELLQVLLLVL